MRHFSAVAMLVLICPDLVGQVDPPNAEPAGAAKVDSSKKKLLPLLEDTSRTFIYSLGTNFDFIEDVQVSKTYHDIQVWVPRISKSAGWGRFGLDFRFSRYRTFSTPDSSDLQYRDVNGTLVVDGPDTTVVLSYITNNVKEKTTSRFDKVGFRVDPLYRLSHEENESFFCAYAPSFEWQRSTFTKDVNRTFEKVVSDTVPPDWPVPYNTTSFLPKAKEQFQSSTDDLYLGWLGLRLMYRNSIGTLNLKAIWGYSWSKTVPKDGNVLILHEGQYYSILAEIIERKSGVKLGTQFRSFIGLNRESIDRNIPQFNVFIAKEFSLDKIGELLRDN